MNTMGSNGASALARTGIAALLGAAIGLAQAQSPSRAETPQFVPQEMVGCVTSDYSVDAINAELEPLVVEYEAYIVGLKSAEENWRKGAKGACENFRAAVDRGNVVGKKITNLKAKIPDCAPLAEISPIPVPPLAECPPVDTASWGAPQYNGGQEFFIAPKPIDPVGRFPGMWMKVTLAKPDSTSGAMSFVMLARLDCDQRTFSTETTLGFSDRDATRIVAIEAGQPVWQPMGEGVHADFCTRPAQGTPQR